MILLSKLFRSYKKKARKININSANDLEAVLQITHGILRCEMNVNTYLFNI